jgi:hypothetical protein
MLPYIAMTKHAQYQYRFPFSNTLIKVDAISLYTSYIIGKVFKLNCVGYVFVKVANYF